MDYAEKNCFSCAKPSPEYKYCSGKCHNQSDHINAQGEIACPICKIMSKEEE